MKIKKNIFWLVLIMVLLVMAGFFVFSSENTIKNGEIKVNSGDIQVVKMYVSGSQYIFEPASVIKGKPVRIEAEISKMPGCAKSIISSDLGIRKTLTSSDNTITFTPDKAGTFYVACSMNMYRGNLIVVDSGEVK